MRWTRVVNGFKWFCYKNLTDALFVKCTYEKWFFSHCNKTIFKKWSKIELCTGLAIVTAPYIDISSCLLLMRFNLINSFIFYIQTWNAVTDRRKSRVAQMKKKNLVEFLSLRGLKKSRLRAASVILKSTQQKKVESTVIYGVVLSHSWHDPLEPLKMGTDGPGAYVWMSLVSHLGIWLRLSYMLMSSLFVSSPFRIIYALPLLFSDNSFYYGIISFSRRERDADAGADWSHLSSSGHVNWDPSSV